MAPPVARLDAAQVAEISARADTGSADDQVSLGEAYMYGNGVARDYAKARLWLGKAADQGLLEAMTDIANMYYLGDLGASDDAAAAAWLQKAADYGDGPAETALGQMYEKGEGVTRDLIQAYKWIYLANRSDMATYNGEYLARQQDRVAAEMTQEQIAEARSQADMWQAKPRSAAQLAKDTKHRR